MPMPSASPTTRGSTWNGRSAPPSTWTPPEPAMRTDRRPWILAALCAACGHGTAKIETDHAAFGLTASQRARIHVEAVSDTTFRPTVEVTATVAFDGDHSTQVLAPISGPVSRIL